MGQGQAPLDPDQFLVLKHQAEGLLALDALSPSGALDLGRRRREALSVMDMLATNGMVQESCELGLHLELALEQLGEPPDPQPEGSPPGRHAVIEHLLGIARAGDHSFYEGEALLRKAELCREQGEPEQAAGLYAEVQELAQAEQLGVLEVAALAGQAQLALGENNLFKAHLLYGKQLAVATAMEEDPLRSQALSNLAATALGMGDHRRAARYARENLELCERMEDPEGAAESLCSLAMAQRHLGESAESRKCYREALRRARALGNEKLEAAVCYNFGCLLKETEPALSAGLLHHAHDLAGRCGARNVQSASRSAQEELSARLPAAELARARREAQQHIRKLLGDP